MMLTELIITEEASHNVGLQHNYVSANKELECHSTSMFDMPESDIFGLFDPSFDLAALMLAWREILIYHIQPVFSTLDLSIRLLKALIKVHVQYLKHGPFLELKCLHW